MGLHINFQGLVGNYYQKNDQESGANFHFKKIKGSKIRVEGSTGLFKRLILLMKIDTFHPLRNGGHYFVRNGVDPFGNILHGQFGTKNDHLIAFFYLIDIGYIKHGHIHSNSTNDRRLFPVDDHFANAIPKMP